MEVCIDSVASAINAEKGGAIRVELCANLMEGGTTPSLGMLKTVKEFTNLPVFVMIRPRGGDFLYTDAEVTVMKNDITALKTAGADGFVIGVLTEEGEIDKDTCRQLIGLCRPRPVTFHRAIDMCKRYETALETIIQLGCERVLTSGLENSALEGVPVIKNMVDIAKERIIVMPGGGINERNLQRILDGTGAKEFHCSARSTIPSNMSYRNTAVAMGASISPPEFQRKITDIDKVRKLVYIAKGVTHD
ncbi:unnamed protein product [Owenia fusiformis]|uniref:Copper homeostasis protein cutC homolog n=1 Tax=Owenia fusiformis TaxID=6347 RepID=A0A8J1XET7_OWEFU|nr:unnamed protein product [Owenia fusiformis]